MFEKENIYLDIEAKDHTELFTKMAEIFKEKGYVKESYLDAIIEREKKYPTGFEFDGYNIALPHTDAEHVLVQKTVIVRLKKEIKYKEVVSNKEIPVKLFIMLLVKNGYEQTEILEKLIAIYIIRRNIYGYFAMVYQFGSNSNGTCIINTVCPYFRNKALKSY